MSKKRCGILVMSTLLAGSSTIAFCFPNSSFAQPVSSFVQREARRVPRGPGLMPSGSNIGPLASVPGFAGPTGFVA
ncbi:hypothetical protein AA0488_2617 [Kozakia baliensis NRIC 0488]|nr:hypothetical protein AA0488_2617 [Kozakia baliensis NRIC 0488]